MKTRNTQNPILDVIQAYTSFACSDRDLEAAGVAEGWTFFNQFKIGFSTKNKWLLDGDSTVENPNKGLWNKEKSPLFDPKSKNGK